MTVAVPEFTALDYGLFLLSGLSSFVFLVFAFLHVSAAVRTTERENAERMSSANGHGHEHENGNNNNTANNDAGSPASAIQLTEMNAHRDGDGDGDGDGDENGHRERERVPVSVIVGNLYGPSMVQIQYEESIFLVLSMFLYFISLLALAWVAVAVVDVSAQFLVAVTSNVLLFYDLSGQSVTVGFVMLTLLYLFSASIVITFLIRWCYFIIAVVFWANYLCIYNKLDEYYFNLNVCGCKYKPGRCLCGRDAQRERWRARHRKRLRERRRRQNKANENENESESESKSEERVVRVEVSAGTLWRLVVILLGLVVYIFLGWDFFHFLTFEVWFFELLFVLCCVSLQLCIFVRMVCLSEQRYYRRWWHALFLIPRRDFESASKFTKCKNVCKCVMVGTLWISTVVYYFLAIFFPDSLSAAFFMANCCVFEYFFVVVFQFSTRNLQHLNVWLTSSNEECASIVHAHLDLDMGAEIPLILEVSMAEAQAAAAADDAGDAEEKAEDEQEHGHGHEHEQAPAPTTLCARWRNDCRVALNHYAAYTINLTQLQHRHDDHEKVPTTQLCLASVFLALLVAGIVLFVYVRNPTNGLSHQFEATQLWSTHADGEYPICKLSFFNEQLFIHDILFFTQVAYETTPAHIQANYATLLTESWFGGDLANTSSWQWQWDPWLDIALLSNASTSTANGNKHWDVANMYVQEQTAHSPPFIHLYNRAFNLDVVAVRGTLSPRDMLEDLSLYMLPVIMQLVSNVVPLTTIFSVEKIRNALSFQASMFGEVINRQERGAAAWSQSVVDYIELAVPYRESNRSVWVVGHSLGGALAKITAAHFRDRGYGNVVAFALSAPGTSYSAAILGLSEQAVEDSIQVLAARDVVPMVDKQGGLVQSIDCHAGSFLGCHSGRMSLCEISTRCNVATGTAARNMTLLECICTTDVDDMYQCV